MSNDFHGTVALVRGAAMGLGETIAEAMYSLGAGVVIADIDLDGVEALARRLDSDGHRVLPTQVDVSDPTSVQEMVTKAVARFGTLHLAVNNSGITGHTKFP